MINTPRLRLKPLSPDDVWPVYVDWLNNPDVNRFLETRHASKQTQQSVKEFVAACADDPDTMLFGAFLKAGGAHIGNIKLGPIHRRYGTAEVGLVIGAAQARGQGLGVEMIEGLANHAFAVLGLRKLTAGCYEANLASLRAFLKCGFTVEGFRSGEVLYQGAPHGLFLLGRLRENRHG